MMQRFTPFLVIKLLTLLTCLVPAAVAQERAVDRRSIGSETKSILLDSHDDAILATAYNQDGDRMAVASRDQHVSVWRRKREAVLTKFKPHQDAVNDVIFLDDGKLVATASDDHTVAVWQLEPSKLHLRLKGHAQPVTCVEVLGDRLYSGSMDGTVRVWDLKTGAEKRVLKCPGGGVTALVVLPAVRAEAEAKPEAPSEAKSPTAEDAGPEAEAPRRPRPPMIVAGVASGKLIVWRDLGKSPQPLNAHSEAITDLARTADGERVAAACNNGRVSLWSTWRWRQIRRFQAHDGAATSVVFLAKGRLMATAGGPGDGEDQVQDKEADGEPGDIVLWESPTATPLLRFTGWQSRPSALAAADGEELLSGSGESAARLWHVPRRVSSTLPVERIIATLTKQIDSGDAANAALAAIYEKRAHAYMQLDRWQHAVDDFRQASKLAPLNNMHRLRSGIFSQVAHDPAAHRDSAREIARALSNRSTNMYVAERTVKVCVISPKPIGDRKQLEKLAAASVERSKNIRWSAFFPSTQSLMFYRYGEYDRAREAIKEVRRRNKAPGDWPEIPELTNLLIESLCAAQERKLPQAREALQAALPKLQPFRDDPASVGFSPWHDWLTCQLLYIEARDLIFSLEQVD